MAVRGARLLSALAAGGVLTGSLLLGGGTALAQTSPYPEPTPTGNTIPAQCGQSVTATAGDQVLVTPLLGAPFTRMATAGMDPISATLGGVLCQVDVSVVAPTGGMLTQIAPEPLRTTVGTVTGTASSALRPVTQAPPPATMAPAPLMAPAPAAMYPAAVAPMPALTPQQLAASAPFFAPAFSSLPASFLAGATAPSAGLPAMAPTGRMMDPSMLFGSSFPGLRAGAPAYLGYDPASAVTTASQVQALPVDGLPSSGGIGLPILVAVLVLAGVAAFAVRRSVIGSRTVAAAGPAATGPVAPAKPAAPAAAALSTGSGAVKKAAKPTDAEQTVVTDVEKTVVTSPAALGTATA